MTPEAREALTDLLLDLSHDLGKYLVMPLSFLPAAASPDEVRAALAKALHQTHPPHSARALWERFSNEAAPLIDLARLAPLAEAVEVALTWEAPPEPFERRDAERDLRAVGEAIRRLLEELRDG